MRIRSITYGVAILAISLATMSGVSHGTILEFNYRDVSVRYMIHLSIKPLKSRDIVELHMDSSSLEVILKNESPSTKSDYSPPKAQEIILLTQPKDPNSAVNKVGSMSLRGSVSSEVKWAPLQRLAFRNDGTGHFSLSVITEPNAQFYIPRLLGSTATSLINEIDNNPKGMIDLEKLTPALVSAHTWPFRSSTNAVVFEDPNGFLVMQGTIEFVIMPAIGGVNESAIGIGELRGSGTTAGILNLGEGSQIKVRDLTNPLLLMEGDGKTYEVKQGNFIYTKGKWEKSTK